MSDDGPTDNELLAQISDSLSCIAGALDDLLANQQRSAWDRYAAAARVAHPEWAVDAVAKHADAMLDERLARFAEKE